MNIQSRVHVLILVILVGMLFAASNVMAQKEGSGNRKAQLQVQKQGKELSIPQQQLPQSKAQALRSSNRHSGTADKSRDRSQVSNRQKQFGPPKSAPAMNNAQQPNNGPSDKKTSKDARRVERRKESRGHQNSFQASKVRTKQDQDSRQPNLTPSGKPALDRTKISQKQPEKFEPSKFKKQDNKSKSRPIHTSKPQKVTKHSKNSFLAKHQNDKRKSTVHVSPGHKKQDKNIRPAKRQADWSRQHQKLHKQPKPKVVKHVVHHLPPRHSVIRHGQHTYHYHSGRYYRPHGTGFILVRPPVGLFMLSLPIGSRTVISAGITYHVFGDIYYGKVSGGYRVVAPPRITSSALPGQVTVTAELLNLRYSPGEDEEIIAQIEAYTVLDVLGSVPGWLYVTLPGEDIQGWVREEYVSASVG